MATDTQTLKLRVYAKLAARDTGGVIRCSAEGCDVDELMQLTIDHISGDGALERRLKSRGGVDYYRYLLRDQNLDGKRLLCANHNMQAEMEQRNGAPRLEHGSNRREKQINPKLRAHTLQFIAQKKLEWQCTYGDVIDRLVQEYQSTTVLIQEMHAKLCGDTSNPSSILPQADTPAPPIDPYAYLHAPSAPEMGSHESMDVALPKRSLLRRIFG